MRSHPLFPQPDVHCSVLVEYKITDSVAAFKTCRDERIVTVSKHRGLGHAGHAGMEAAVANLIEPGETMLVGNTGIWGVRAAELATRYGGANPKPCTPAELCAPQLLMCILVKMPQW